MKVPKSDLARWMKQHRYTDRQFAELINPYLSNPVRPATVFKWRHCKTIPRRDALRAIYQVTDKEVHVSSFYLEEQCA